MQPVANKIALWGPHYVSRSICSAGVSGLRRKRKTEEELRGGRVRNLLADIVADVHCHNYN